MDNTASPMPPLSRLRPFEAAARLESFSAAAAELGMTQAAVSKQVALLEREIGTTLFERRNRAVFLTEAGRRLGRVVGEALSDITREMALIRGQRRSRELVLHCQLCEAFYWLMPRLSGFHQHHPDVELRVVSSLKPLTEAVETFDVAMQTAHRASGTARLAFTAADEIFPVCAPSLIPSGDLPLTPADLTRYPLLAHHVVPQDWMDWPDWFEAVGARLPTHPRLVPIDSYPLALQAAVSGQGIAIGWRLTTQGMIEDGRLIRPCAEFVARPADMAVYRSRTRNRHPDTDKLLDWLKVELTG